MTARITPDMVIAWMAENLTGETMFKRNPPPPDQRTITRDQLVAAFTQWEVDARIGNCMPLAEFKRLSANEAGASSADALLRYLDAQP